MNVEPQTAEDIKLKHFLEDCGYWNIRFLPDGVVCNARMMFTTAVLVDVNHAAYEKRFCYENHALAEVCCLQMTSVDDEPLPGWTALKGRYYDEHPEER